MMYAAYSFVLLVLCGIVLISPIALIIASIMRKWKAAAFFGIIVTMVVAVIVVAMSSASHIRKPVGMAELTGTYRPSPSARSALSDAGYKVLTGEITLRPDGSFTATRIPSCIYTGEEPRESPFTQYYDFSGSWKTGMSGGEYGVAIVELALAETKLFYVPYQGSPSQIELPKDSTGPAVNILSGSPLSLGFQIFNGDFYDITYSSQPP